MPYLNRSHQKLALLMITKGLCLSITAHAQPTKEVPFITSPGNVTLNVLSSAGVKRGDHVINLGSGSVRTVIDAATSPGGYLPLINFFSTRLAVSQLAG